MVRHVLPLLLLLCAFCRVDMLAAQEAGAPWEVISVQRMGVQVWRGGSECFRMEAQITGPQGANPILTEPAEAQDGRRVFVEDLSFKPRRSRGREALESFRLDFRLEIERAGRDALSVKARGTANERAWMTGPTWNLPTGGFFEGGRLTVVDADGKSTDYDLPLVRTNLEQPVKSMTLTTRDGTRFALAHSAPMSVATDAGGNLQISLWPRGLKAGEPVESAVVMRFPGEVRFTAENQLVDTSGWFPYAGRQDFSPGSPIGMREWLDAPAGKHGFVQEKGAQFVFEDGTPVKFWGTNISYALPATPPEDAERWADKYAKYGVNLVRFHKFTGHRRWNGFMDPENPLEFDEPRARLFDNFHAELRERGIYVGWSPIFAIQFHEKFRDRLVAYDEIVENRPKLGGMFGNSLYPLSTFATDVQDLYIEIIVRWLNRRNTVTGLRYAEDPALAYVECQNEADVFFYVGNIVDALPTYKKLFQGYFCDWLKERYPDDAALRKAWGDELREGESLAQRNISPFQRYDGSAVASPRTADSYTFLYVFQVGFYERFAAAVRETGYKGALVSSCWRGGDTYGQLYNIASDREVGFIDRHNYFSGAERPMVSAPGSALVGAGGEQVTDRPFALSEWAGPHQWATECPPVIGFIGLGLQGWDMSAQFASSWSGIRTDNRGGVNVNCDLFYNLGQYPFIARALHAGIREGAPICTRRVSTDGLRAGKVGIDPPVANATGRLASVYGVPETVLGAGRVAIEYTDAPAEPAVLLGDLDGCIDAEKRVIRANNGQIVWDYSGRGFFTLDTPSAAAVIGFGGGGEHRFGDVTVAYENEFANVYVVPRRPGRTLADADELLVMTIARTADRGDVFERTQMRILERGPVPEWQQKNAKDYEAMLREPPTLIIEPVRASLTFANRRPAEVLPLDHDGRLRADAAPIAVTGGHAGYTVPLDGKQLATMYYLVRFED